MLAHVGKLKLSKLQACIYISKRGELVLQRIPKSWDNKWKWKGVRQLQTARDDIENHAFAAFSEKCIHLAVKYIFEVK